jgi:hypothetical protein
MIRAPLTGNAPVDSLGRMLERSPLIRRSLDALTLVGLAWMHRLFAAPYLFAYVANDERYFLWEGWSVTRGLVPYRDFQEFKPPMVFLVNAAALALFGLPHMRYRLFFWLFSLAGFLALGVALLNRGVRRWMILGAFPFLFSLFFDGNLHDSSLDDAESAAIPFFLVGTALLVARGRWLRARVFLGSASLALVPLCKEPLAFMVLLTWVALVALARAESAEGAERATVSSFVRCSLLGVGAVIVWWGGYLVLTHSVGDYVTQLRQTMIFTRNYAAVIGRTPEIPWAGDVLTNAHLFVVGVLAASGLAVGGRRRAPATLWAVAALVASFYAVTVGGAYWRHYFLMALPGVFLVSALALIYFCEASRNLELPRVALSVAWTTAAIVVFGRVLLDTLGSLALYDIPGPPPVSEQTVAVIEEQSAPDECIWTTGDPLLYVYANRCDAVKEGVVLDELLMLYPGNTDEERVAGERAALDAHPPRLVVLGNDEGATYGRKARYIEALVMPFLRAHGYVPLSETIYRLPG